MLTGGNLPSFSAPSKAHSSQLLLPHSHPRRLSESSCTETTCSFSTVCITLPQKRDKVNRNSSCLIRFLQKSLRISCQLFYTTPTFFIPHQRSAAPVSAPASVGAGRSPPGSSTRGGSRDQVLLPLPQNRRKHWVFAGSLFSCVAWLCGSLWFKLRVFPSGFTRSQPFPPSPAPKTHPVLPFSAQTGCVSLFLPSFDLQNFRLCFCAD